MKIGGMRFESQKRICTFIPQTIKYTPSFVLLLIIKNIIFIIVIVIGLLTLLLRQHDLTILQIYVLCLFQD